MAQMWKAAVLGLAVGVPVAGWLGRAASGVSERQGWELVAQNNDNDRLEEARQKALDDARRQEEARQRQLEDDRRREEERRKAQEEQRRRDEERRKQQEEDDRRARERQGQL